MGLSKKQQTNQRRNTMKKDKNLASKAALELLKKRINKKRCG